MHGVILELCLALQSENLRDSSSKSSLTMVNVTDCTDVYMGLISFELMPLPLELSSFYSVK